MARGSIRVRDERGVALVAALLVLFVLSLLSAAMMAIINVETKIAGHSVRESRALNAAEAGVAEAVARLRNGDIPNNNNPRMVAQIFNAPAGSVPVVGADSIAMETKQPPGQWLQYSTAGKGPDVLTVKYKTNAARTVIYRHDPNKNPAVQTATGYPIFVITSTGTTGSTLGGKRVQEHRRIVTEVIQKPVDANIRAAFAADVVIQFLGNSYACGFNHGPATPTGDQIPACNNDHVGSGDLPGSYSTGAIISDASSSQDGWPVDNQPNQVGFYAGPWECLGMGQVDFFAWVGAPVANEPMPPRGIFYLDDNTTTQDQSGDFAYHGGDGEGLLYVDGDLTLNGIFTFRGLIYVEGDLNINGTAWVLGAVVVKGRTTVKIANGDCTVLYSSETISQKIAQYGGQFVTLRWREVTF